MNFLNWQRFVQKLWVMSYCEKPKFWWILRPSIVSTANSQWNYWISTYQQKAFMSFKWWMREQFFKWNGQFKFWLIVQLSLFQIDWRLWVWLSNGFQHKFFIQIIVTHFHLSTFVREATNSMPCPIPSNWRAMSYESTRIEHQAEI